jgi:hypothetical protein
VSCANSEPLGLNRGRNDSDKIKLQRYCDRYRSRSIAQYSQPTP